MRGVERVDFIGARPRHRPDPLDPEKPDRLPDPPEPDEPDEPPDPNPV
jgi:hypothetical protein